MGCSVVAEILSIVCGLLSVLLLSVIRTPSHGYRMKECVLVTPSTMSTPCSGRDLSLSRRTLLYENGPYAGRSSCYFIPFLFVSVLAVRCVQQFKVLLFPWIFVCACFLPQHTPRQKKKNVSVIFVVLLCLLWHGGELLTWGRVCGKNHVRTCRRGTLKKKLTIIGTHGLISVESVTVAH